MGWHFQSLFGEIYGTPNTSKFRSACYSRQGSFLRWIRYVPDTFSLILEVIVSFRQLVTLKAKEIPLLPCPFPGKSQKPYHFAVKSEAWIIVFGSKPILRTIVRSRILIKT